MNRNYSNTAVATTLSGGVTNVATAWTVADGSTYPAVPFAAVCENEVVLVTAKSGTLDVDWTVTRAYDGTTGASHADTAIVEHAVIAADFSPTYYTLSMSVPGDLTVSSGTLRVPIARAGTITGVRAMVNTAPTGASIILDVNLNGTSIYPTSAKPTIAASGFDSGDTPPDTTALVAGDYLQVDVDQVGSTIAGSDAVLVVEIQQ